MNIAFYQIDFGSLMRIWMVEQEATTRLKQVACHFYGSDGQNGAEVVWSTAMRPLVDTSKIL